MATGDVQGSVERLKSELRHIRYPAELDSTGAKLGVAAAFLPVLNYVLLKFSRHVAHQLVSSGYELQGKTDARFVEAAFKIFRDKFGLRPVITAAQFLEQGFAERKLLLLSDVIAYCKSFHNAAVRRARLAAASASTKSGNAARSSKAGASQASKASGKSKTKSGLSRASQPARVQRHSGATPETDSATISAAAALQARLSPSPAQLANPDQSQNTNPNPWGPPAHALGSHALQARQAMANLSSQSQPTSMFCDSHAREISRPAQMPAQGPHWRSQQQYEQQQQVVNTDGVLTSKTQPKAGSMLEATQAWFMNPAFGNNSPMPSPEKQPRSQPPPQPHPGTYTGAGAPLGYHPTEQHSSLSAAPAAASWGQTSPVQQRAAASSGVAHDLQKVHMSAQEPSLQSMSSTAAPPHTQTTQHQQPSQNRPRSSAQGHKGTANGVAWSSAYQQQRGRTSSDAAHSPSHGFSSLLASQQQQQKRQDLPAAWQSIPDPAQHGSQVQPGSLRQQLPPHAQQASQHAQHAHSSWPLAAAHPHKSQQNQAQQLAWHQQHQQELHAPESWDDQVQQLPRQQQDLKLSAGGDRMSDYVGQLQERLAAAEEQAAHARMEGDRRAQTLEARITVLEGRVRFVEGELASERERSRQAVQPGIAEAQSPNRGYSSPRRGQVAVCLSPSAARSQQQPAAAAQPCVLGQTAARSAAAFPVAAPTSTVPQESRASPTRSTAGTPGYKSAKYGCVKQLGPSAAQQYSPMQQTKADIMPASPASSMHSYKSTSELIESMQNRYLEAQSFLKSYKM